MLVRAVGFGLAFCAEHLTLDKVARTAVLNGKVKQMIADGQRFCSDLAAHSGAVVYAATDTQWYHQVPSASLIR